MDRTALRKNRIVFHEELVDATNLPPHISALRSALLDFDCTIPDRLSLSDDEDFRGFRSILDELDISGKEQSAVTATVERFSNIKEDAEKLYHGRDREAEWQMFFFNHFFSPLANEMRVRDEDTRRSSRIKYYYDYFEHAQGRPWTLFERKKGFRGQDRIGLTEPKPDWVAFFPVYDFAVSDRIPTSPRWRWRKSPKDRLIGNFTRKNLDSLHQLGLESNTAGLFRRDEKGPPILSDFVCFPWMVVEHKKSRARETQCYCQAANAGSAAVMMLHELSRYAESQERNGHVPPIVTMTTVDKDVRVWITYSCEDLAGYRMDCVWKGDMTHLVDLLKLEALLENLHTWAMRVLRPWISTYIDLWNIVRSKDLKTASAIPQELHAPSLQTLVRLDVPGRNSPVPSNSTENEDDRPLSESAFRTILQEEHQALLHQLFKIHTETQQTNGSGLQPQRHFHGVGVKTDTTIALRQTPRNLFKTGHLIRKQDRKPIRVKLPDVPSWEIRAQQIRNDIINSTLNRKTTLDSAPVSLRNSNSELLSGKIQEPNLERSLGVSWDPASITDKPMFDSAPRKLPTANVATDAEVLRAKTKETNRGGLSEGIWNPVLPSIPKWPTTTCLAQGSQPSNQ